MDGGTRAQSAGSGEQAALTVSGRLAAFAIGLQLEHLPPGLLDMARTHLLDGLGIALASSGFDFAGPILKGASLLGSGSGARALASGAPLPAAGAALVNGTLIHGLDFDDTHIGAIYHATAPALAAALAAAQACGASGRAFLCAFIAAHEIGCRLGLAAEGGFHDRGFHPTPLCGAYAATFAAGRLMGADIPTLVSASGLAGSMAAGMLELKGSWLKRLHPGWAAHSGVSAATLAISGFTGPAETFEGGHGFYHTHLQRIPTGDKSPAHGIGQTWVMEGTALKPYPCCHFIHGFVDCALALRPQVELDQIERIECPLSARLQHMVSGPPRPADAYSAMFSVPYVVALALVTGRVDLAAFHDKGVNDPAVLAIAERTTCSNDPESDFPVHFPGEVRITLKDGRTLSHRVATSLGTPERRLGTAEVEAKFMANATRVMDAAAATRVMRAVAGLQAADTLDELTQACTVRPAA